MVEIPVKWVNLVDFGRKVVKMVPPGSGGGCLFFSWFKLILNVGETPTGPNWTPTKTGRF